MTVAVVAGDRDCDVKDLIRRSPVAGIYDAEVLLKRWLKTSEEVWFGMHDGQIACVYGLNPPSVISNRAYLWLFTTDIIDEHKFLFIRNSQIVVKKALERYPTIVGHVTEKNYAARKWLKWLGAEIDQPTDGYSNFVIRR